MQRRVHALFTIGALLVATDAYGYCRKTTCKDCPYDPDTGCIVGGQPLIWPNACASYSLSRVASMHVGLSTAQEIAQEAFEAWQSVTCPGSGEPPSIHISNAFGGTGCTLAEYSRTGANANVLLFRDDAWPYEGEGGDADVLGITTASFDSVTGQIMDADIEVNATKPLSATDDVPPDSYDLRSILTHEAGHFLGLSHSQPQHTDAVMRRDFGTGSASLRVPSDDDIAGICAIYPPYRRSLPCDFTPKNGFASECPLGVFRGGCAMSPRPVEPSGPWIFFALAAVVTGLRRLVSKVRARR